MEHGHGPHTLASTRALLSVRSYGASRSSGSTSPCTAERMNHRSQLRSTNARRPRNRGDVYRSSLVTAIPASASRTRPARRAWLHRRNAVFRAASVSPSSCPGRRSDGRSAPLVAAERGHDLGDAALSGLVGLGALHRQHVAAAVAVGRGVEASLVPRSYPGLRPSRREHDRARLVSVATSTSIVSPPATPAPFRCSAATGIMNLPPITATVLR